MVTEERHVGYVRIIRQVSVWADRRRDVMGVAVVGSWARREARMDSDIDLVVLTDDKERYRREDAWVPEAVGEPAELVRTLAWGPLVERRVSMPSGLEVEFGFVSPSWATADPVDPGTARVIGEGCSPLVDPEGVFDRVIRAVSGI